MSLFDTHCHLMDDQFDDDLGEVIRNARDAGVSHVVIPAVDVASAHRAIAIAQQYDGVYAAVGIHPEAAKDVPDGDFDVIRQLAMHPKVVAIGEIGLDYYWDAAPRPEQQAVLRRQIEIAKRVKLPVIIHNRESTEDILTVLESSGAAEVGGIMHCFNETIEVAKTCLDMSFYISFGGPVTFKRADDVRAVAAQIPSDRLLVETDSPYLSPHPYRGKRNEPARVQLIAQQVADVRGESFEAIAACTTENAFRIFRKVMANG